MAILELSSFNPQPLHDGIQVVLDYGDYELSIVKHSGSYGHTQGKYEIMVFKHGGPCEMPGITEEHDSIKGYLTESDVNIIIKKMYIVTGKSPEQI
jgi:hypothetical protein